MTINANLYDVIIIYDFNLNKISVKRVTIYKTLSIKKEFINIREYNSNLKDLSNGKMEILLDKTVIEMKMIDGSTFTLLKFLENNDIELLNFDIKNSTNISYDLYDLKNI
ncbi:hypothetical protein [Spiroplasma turonicum]|uniref:Uncharacterized protein n=1 Tax=Spiroplasma turonicum TaxID=216946 RepID=A0A0K1P6N4_9MOLU|nr:hypothetical protein [Spiroplasma turonicum]AKU79968.1 hypothetical protein STURON_00722 [Spiroplasma turonicum]